MSETAAETTEPQTAPPAAEPQATEPAAPSPFDDPAVKAELEKLRRENGAARINAKQQAAEEARQELLKQLGLVTDDQPADPKELAQQLTAAQQAAQDTARELAIFKAAAEAKADANALLDSRTFLNKVQAIDPTDTDALAAAISEATTSNTRFKATQAAAVGGADISGGAAAPRTYTRAQLADPAFYKANRTDIQNALREGRIRQ